MNKGGLVIISGFSGAGKGTIVKKLMERYPDEYVLSISATTRNPRTGEEEGVDYFFKTKEEFEEMIRQDEFLEYAFFVDRYYGTPREFVLNNLNAGKNVILEIDRQGAMKVQKKFPEVVMIFLTPPDAEELKRRLMSRGTETMEVIEQRLEQAVEEAKFIDAYDYLLINETGKVDECVENVHGVIQIEKMKTFRNQEKIRSIRNELQ